MTKTKEQRPDIDELLSAYIDGQLTERRQNEVHRLIQHDPEIADKLLKLQKQKELLNAMPVETSPPSMLDDIKYALERKLILEECPRTRKSTAGARHLMFRKTVAAAAMIAVVGALVYVLYTIVAPPPKPDEIVKDTYKINVPDPDDNFRPDPFIKESVSNNPTALASLGFVTAELEINTSNVQDVSNRIWKAIHDLKLRDDTVPNREAWVSTYRITTASRNLAALMEKIEDIWYKCEDTKLSVYDRNSVVVDQITALQAAAVFGQTDIPSRFDRARVFAGFNSVTNQLPYELDSKGIEISEGILTKDYDLNGQHYQYDESSPDTMLTITIRGI